MTYYDEPMTVTELLRGLADGQKKEKKHVLDSADDAISNADLRAAKYTMQHIRLLAANTIRVWAQTTRDDLDDDEAFSDRLLMQLVGIVDEDKDGELSDEESEYLDELLEATADYLEHIGVSDEDIGLLLNDWDEDAAERIRDLLNAGKSVYNDDADGDNAAAWLNSDDDEDDEIDIENFVFGDEAEESIFDATYKPTMAFRHGKRARINKRVSGTVRLSAKQKMAVNKMHRKSHTAAANARRSKTMKLAQKF